MRAVSATKSGSNLVLDCPGVGRDKERLQGGGASERESERERERESANSVEGASRTGARERGKRRLEL